MTKTLVMSELKKMGAAQNRKIFGCHGATGEMFGVSSANLRALRKKIGTVVVDHGETGCKTPDAVVYLEKTWARRKK